MYRIRQTETGGELRFNSIRQIDDLVNPSFDSEEIKKFYQNETDKYRIETVPTATMVEADVLDGDQLIEILEWLESANYEIECETGTFFDAYAFTKNANSLIHRKKKYRFGLILPDYNVNRMRVYLTNNEKDYNKIIKGFKEGENIK